MHSSPLDVLMVTTLAHLNDPSSVTDIPMLSTDQMVVTTNDLPKQLHDITKPDEIVATNPTHARSDIKMEDEEVEIQQQHHHHELTFTRPNLVQEKTQGNTPTNHPLSSSSNNNNTSCTKKSVRFNSVSIRIYNQCFGDHPCCSDGLPLSLDWTYTETPTIDIDTYEKTKQGIQLLSSTSSYSSINSRSSIQSFRLSGHERKCILEKLPSYQKHKMLGCRMDRDQSSFHLGDDEENDLCFQSFTNLDDLFTVSLDASSDTSSLGCNDMGDNDDDSCLVGKDLHDVFDVEMIDNSNGGGGVNISSCTKSTTSCSDDSSISSIDNHDMTLLLVPSLKENELTISSMSSTSSEPRKTVITEMEEKEQASSPPSSSLSWKRAERRNYRETQGFVRRRVNHEFFTPPTTKSSRNKDTSVELFLES